MSRSPRRAPRVREQGRTGGRRRAMRTILGAAAVALIPFVGYVMTLAAGWLLMRQRRREDQKFRGLRVLR